MKILLRNGKELDIQITPLLLEYLEEYENGIEQLLIDVKGNEKAMYAVNHVLYSLVCSNYDEALTYRQAVRLVNVNDMQRLVDYLLENVKNLDIENKNEEIKNNKHRM